MCLAPNFTRYFRVPKCIFRNFLKIAHSSNPMKDRVIYLHIYVDGVDARDTIMDANTSAMKGRQVSGLLGLFTVLRIEKLHQTPVLNDSLGHGNLTIGRSLDNGKQLPKGCQIPKIGRQVVHIKGLGMKAMVGNMRGIEPITV